MQSNGFFLKIYILIIWLSKYDPGFHFWAEIKHEKEMSQKIKDLTTNIDIFKWNVLLINSSQSWYKYNWDSLAEVIRLCPKRPDSILGLAGKEAKWRLLCRYFYNHLKCNHLQIQELVLACGPLQKWVAGKVIPKSHSLLVLTLE